MIEACGFKLRVAAVLTIAVVVVLGLGADQAFANHVHCGDTITQDTTLDGDLLNCGGHGLVIGANNVTVDLGGHTIDGVHFGEVGINNIGGFDGVAVRNGVVQEFATGVWLQGATGNRLEGLTMRDNDNWGLQVEGGGANVITRNTASENAYEGMRLEGGNSLLEENRLADNGKGGALVEFSNGTRIAANVVEANKGSGITLQSGLDTAVDGNRVLHNQLYGIAASASYGVSIEGNSVVGNQHGIGFSNFSSHGRIERNVVSDSFLDGITVFNSTDSLVTRNDVSNNGFRGIGLDNRIESTADPGADRNTVARNTVADNGRGIDLERTDGNTVSENDVSNSFDFGIYLETGAGENLLARNAVTGNRVGIELFGADFGNVVARNRAEENLEDGIVEFALASVIERNAASKNGDDGIQMAFGTAIDNVANQNGDFGIEAGIGVTDGGGNKASRNGNPLQCLNVVCK